MTLRACLALARPAARSLAVRCALCRALVSALCRSLCAALCGNLRALRRALPACLPRTLRAGERGTLWCALCGTLRAALSGTLLRAVRSVVSGSLWSALCRAVRSVVSRCRPQRSALCRAVRSALPVTLPRPLGPALLGPVRAGRRGSRWSGLLGPGLPRPRRGTRCARRLAHRRPPGHPIGLIRSLDRQRRRLLIVDRHHRHGDRRRVRVARGIRRTGPRFSGGLPALRS